MTEISAKLVKDLRDKTGAGMMDCKRALAECGGEIEQAKDWLRKRGQAIADKKASRALSEGLICCQITREGRVGAMVELNCETDFVARNDAFQKLLRDLTAQVAAGGAGTGSGNIEEFLQAPSAGDAGRTIAEALRNSVATLGENIGIGGFVRVESGSEKSVLQSYLHPPGKLGVLVEVAAGKAETRSHPAFQELCRDLAMHVAAAAPEYLAREAVAPQSLDHERAIYRDQAINEGKPEKILDKIVEGKLGKYYERVCLLEQEFVKDGDLSIKKLLEKVSKELSDEIKIVRFERMKVGG